MKAIAFLKYDLRRSKIIILYSIVLFAPLEFVLAYSWKSEIFIFTYMVLIVILGNISLFSQDQKVNCGFDCLLPASEIDRVVGRFLSGIAIMLLNILDGWIVCMIYRIASRGKFVSTISVTLGAFDFSTILIITVFCLAIGLLYLSVLNILLYFMGRDINPQIKNIVTMIPAMILWGIASSFVKTTVITGSGNKILTYIMQHLTFLAAGSLVISLLIYLTALGISIHIVKKKDFR